MLLGKWLVEVARPGEADGFTRVRSMSTVAGILAHHCQFAPAVQRDRVTGGGAVVSRRADAAGDGEPAFGNRSGHWRHGDFFRPDREDLCRFR